MNLRFVVVGTGRCGTGYLAKVLTKLGIPCGHEAIFNEEGKERAEDILAGNRSPENSVISMIVPTQGMKPAEKWVDEDKIVADASYMAAPFLNNILKDTPVIHLVRHPLKVLSSFVKEIEYFKEEGPTNKWEDFLYPYVDFSKAKTQIERACCFCVQWNGNIEKARENYKYIFHRVEDGISDSLLDFLNIEKPMEISVDSKTNSFQKREKDFELSDIPDGEPKKEFIDLIKRYKYQFKLYV